MDKKKLTKDEVLGAIQYAFLHDYEPDECINLLNSKGLHKETESSITKKYSKMSVQVSYE